MPGIDSNTKLMLHLNGNDEATATLDSSPSGHTINFNVTAQLDTAVKKFGSASLLLDGDSDYLSLADSADWDICGSNSDDWTIDLFIKHDDHVGVEHYVRQNQGVNDFWALIHVHGSGLKLLVATLAGGAIIDTGYGGEITDTDQHHFALCKVGSDYGCYLDGLQVNHTNDSSTATFAGSLYIGYSGNAGDPQYFDGHHDEIRIQHSNIFGAAPNATPDDTIVVPTREYSYYDAGLMGSNF